MKNINNFNQIVIGGLQRSGTSLLRAMIGSHPDIAFIQWDAPLLTKFFEIYKEKTFNIEEAKCVIIELLQHEKIKANEIDFDLNYLTNLIETGGEKEYIYEELYSILLNHYLEKTHKKIIGIKTPHNEFYSSEIMKRFPNTKFIHIIRNPLDVFTSLQEAEKKWWNNTTHYYTHIKLWHDSVNIGLYNSTKYPKNYYLLRYEDLIIKPEYIINSICNFLKIEYCNEMLEMKNHPGWKGHNSSFNNPSNASKMNMKSINRYKNNVHQKIVWTYSLLLGKLMSKLGYKIEENDRLINLYIIGVYKIYATMHTLRKMLISKIRASSHYKIIKEIVTNSSTFF